jgi:ADP-ribosylation factor 1/2
MGNYLSSMSNERKISILMTGLDAAGKTTIIYRLGLANVVTSPTIFIVETYTSADSQWICWDLGGQDKLRSWRRPYYQGVTHLIFVIDSDDRDRLAEARDELFQILYEDELREVPLLVFCNKQDLPNAMSVDEITDHLQLHTIRNRAWATQACCATSKEGIGEGLNWLKTGFHQTNPNRFKTTKSARSV